MNSKPELLIVMPVYNEQDCVRQVVQEWFEEIRHSTEDFVFLAINDGSKDNTGQILEQLHDQLGPRMEALSRENRGHGQSCLQGYRIAGERGIPFVMQIDSDGQCDPQYFTELWQLRQNADVIYGVRVKRDDGFRRTFASWVLKMFLLTFFDVYCRDANVPYRLMRTDMLASHIARIPADFSLANIALSVLLKKDPHFRHAYIPIRFRQRYGGEPSVRISRFGGKANELHRQLRKMLSA